jgi:hypothetical protein
MIMMPALRVHDSQHEECIVQPPPPSRSGVARRQRTRNHKFQLIND